MEQERNIWLRESRKLLVVNGVQEAFLIDEHLLPFGEQFGFGDPHEFVRFYRTVYAPVGA